MQLRPHMHSGPQGQSLFTHLSERSPLEPTAWEACRGAARVAVTLTHLLVHPLVKAVPWVPKAGRATPTTALVWATKFFEETVLLVFILLAVVYVDQSLLTSMMDDVFQFSFLTPPTSRFPKAPAAQTSHKLDLDFG